MGTDKNNVLDDLESVISHIEYFAQIKGYTIDQKLLDEYTNNLINLVRKINGEETK